MLNIDITLKYIDIPNPKRLEREPDKIISILTNGNSIENGYEIRNIFLRLYIEKIDKELGPYSIICNNLTKPRSKFITFGQWINITAIF